MSENTPKWKIYCLGTIKLDNNKKDVIQSLQKLFNLPYEKANAMLSGKKILIKTVTSKTTAEKYLKALEQCGVNAVIEEPHVQKMDGLSLAPIEKNKQPEIKPEALPSAEAKNQETFHCPKCQTPQTRDTECIKCGIIFDKYFAIEQKRHQEKELTCDDKIISDDPLDRVISFVKNGYTLAASIILIIFVKFFIWDDSGYQAVGSTEVAKNQWQAYQNALAMPKPSSHEILSLLKHKEYSQLEYILEELEENLASDVIWENAYIQTYEHFSPNNNVKQEDIDAWVNSRNSAYAYLARAAFYHQAGWSARGDKFAKNTSRAQFSSMEKFHDFAANDAMQAYNLNSSLLYAYTLMISLDRTVTEPINTERLLAEAIALNPAAASYRYSYIEGILPKWGGSYEAIEYFVEQQTPYFSLNPMLTTLAGYEDAQKAFYAKNNNDFNSCIHYYSKALSYGLNLRWLDTRAWCSMKEGHYQHAIDDTNISLSIVDNPKVRKVKKYSQYKLR